VNPKRHERFARCGFLLAKTLRDSGDPGSGMVWFVAYWLYTVCEASGAPCTDDQINARLGAVARRMVLLRDRGWRACLDDIQALDAELDDIAPEPTPSPVDKPS
jgi:hypothetical protein